MTFSNALETALPFRRASLRAVVALLAALAVGLSGAAEAQAIVLPDDFQEQLIAGGFTGPVGAAPAPDGRIFVVEKAGRLKVVNPDGSVVTVMDIRDRVNSHWDRGLLGVAVDRDFATNGFVYLAYTYDLLPLTPDSNSPMVARVVRVTVSPANTASPETVILGSYSAGACPPATNTLDCMPSNGFSHSIGTIRVDPNDGSLWIGLGDSASFTVVDELAYRAFDEQSMAGKILHVDTNGNGLPGHPFCPANNNLTHVCTKVHAKGFRNPYRFTVRPDGPPIVGDVQWSTNEELDVVRAGRNYGWPCWEAASHTPGYSSDSRCQSMYATGGDSKPLYYWPHADGSSNDDSAALGGPEYNLDDWPAQYRGNIFVGDYAKGFIRRIRVDASDNCLDQDGAGRCVAQGFATSWQGGVDLQAAPGGGLLHVQFGTGGPNGALRKIVYQGVNRRPTADAQADPRFGSAPLDVSFDGTGSTDPESADLTYDWDFGDGSPHSAAATPTHRYESDGTYTARLAVSDGEFTDTDTVIISVGNAPPSPAIAAPAEGALYRGGETITLRGSAEDPEDGSLPDNGLRWHVTLVHGSHDHPLTALTGSETAFTTTTDHDADSHYRITLTATDSGGLDASTTITIRPETTRFSLLSQPDPGVSLSFGSVFGTTPLERFSMPGYRTTVSAAPAYTRLGKSFVFDGWSDGGELTHNITIPASDSSLTAHYLEDKAGLRPATASSSVKAFTPGKANDVDSTTRWSSSYADNQWWQVDLGTARRVSAVEVNWEVAYASRYKILTSLDGTTFDEAADVSLTSMRIQRTSFPERDARYVRILGLTRATPYGFSFWDARVLGSTDPPPPAQDDLARGHPASASTTHSKPGLDPGKANDGDSNTRWSSVYADNQWWQVDLEQARQVDTVELNWENAYAETYKILTSLDGTDFVEAATVTNSGPGFRRTSFPGRAARYVRVLGLTRGTRYGFSLWDARVFGPG